MSTVLRINHEIEKIVVPGENGQEDVIFEISTNDKNIEEMLHRVGNAMNRFASMQKKLDTASNKQEATEAQEAISRLFKRTISAIVGKDGWEQILIYIGDGKAADPVKNLVTLGEVFAALVTWLYEHCTSKQLRNAGVFFQKEDIKPTPTPRKKTRRK